jgi:hypothetical protein
MANRVRRVMLCLLHLIARRAQSTACAAILPVFIFSQQATAQSGQHLLSAAYAEPTSRYAHGILGDEIEYGALILTYKDLSARTVIRLPQERVFEDTAPRIADVDGDELFEAVTVESHRDQGARLAIYNAAGLVAATPYIGRPNRWLAPVAVADLDGDGAVELAYIDRPHPAKILRVWRFASGTLTEVTSLQSLTNHRTGERDSAGGLRNCGQGLEMIVANADWSRLVAVTLKGSTLQTRDIGPHTNRADFARALVCT